MRRDLGAVLRGWMEKGGLRIGQILIVRIGEGFELRHLDDAGRENLRALVDAADVRELVRYDAHGDFRPLKTAPNLQGGWSLHVAGIRELHQALDTFYPAAVGLMASHERGELMPVDLSETTARQTGMYAVTRNISDDAADEMVGRFCRSSDGCLRTILWKLRPGRPVSSLPREKFDPSAEPGIPLLCAEACNLLIAEARKVVKGASE